MLHFCVPTRPLLTDPLIISNYLLCVIGVLQNPGPIAAPHCKLTYTNISLQLVLPEIAWQSGQKHVARDAW